ncbi:Hypothetical predicted protein [Olea europaea subsp. europaea]|uniref:Transposase n=1 Tax=Olea europaea subsp. europaea TaxID=158383 RepID=A0A8S0PVX1_OLEEU|nr:Hypothetical predicted protein [Olea europaea subsp. europaea]
MSNSASTTEKGKKGRGRAKLNYLNKGKGTKLPVEFNEKGQPICKGSTKLSSFIGTTTRELIPITWKIWKDISKNFLDGIWEHVQQKFDVDTCHRKYIMQTMEKIWRDHRSNVLKVINERGKTTGITRAAALLKPDNVESIEEWQAFVKESNSQPYKEKSERFRREQIKP